MSAVRCAWLAVVLALPAFAADPSGAGRRMGEARPLALEPEREVYGAMPKGGETMALAAVAADPRRFDGKPVRVRGDVDGVCQKRGCWLRLRDGAHQARVRFRDYAFFVPLDLAGRTVVVEGTAAVTVTDERTRRHYAEDAGRSPAEVAAITGDETSLQITADAVEVLGPAGDTAR